VIDADYRSSVKVKLICDQDTPDDQTPLYVKPGDRVAQALIIPIPRVTFTEVE
jgi:dUTP pyrophosphatase